MSKFYFSKSSLSKLEGVDQRLKFLAKEVLRISPIDFAITEGLRTKEEQQRLFKEGKSKCDGINNISKHQEGKAIDICPCYRVRDKETNAYKSMLDYSKESEPDLDFILGLFYLKAKELLEQNELTGGSEGSNTRLRFGCFWDSNSVRENRETTGFVDGHHIELV
jgi:hypothetical protein